MPASPILLNVRAPEPVKIDHIFAPYSPPPTNLIDRLRYWTEKQPEAIAYYYLVDGEDDEVHVTYAQLHERAQAIAARLIELRMCGERALLLYPPGLDYVEALFGCMFARVVPVPAYPPRRNRNMNRIQAISDDSAAKVALTVAEVSNRVVNMLDETPNLKQLTWLATDEIRNEEASQFKPVDVTGDTLALLQYTSGSTGDPKGVMITHANLMHNCFLICGAFEFSRLSSAVSWLPLYHDMGLLGGVLTPMFIGRPQTLMSPMAFLQKPARWLRTISRYSATISGGPNFAYALCNEKITEEDCKGLDLHTWDLAFNGAEPVRADTLEEFTRKFAPYGFRAETHYPCYGMAETTLIVTGGVKKDRPIVRAFNSNALDDRRVVPIARGDQGARRLVGCGRVLWDEDVAIVDPDTRARIHNGKVGEIWVSSPSVGQGYWNKPEESESTFRVPLAGNGDGKYLRTGDLGFLLDGELFVTGRLKDLVIIRGVNRYPQDIEATVEQSSDRLRSAGAACFALDVQGRERLVIVCEVERGRNQQWDDVITAIRRNVSSQHEVPPDAVILVRAGSIPKTSSGKIQRKGCRIQFLEDKMLVVAQWRGWSEDDQTQSADVDPPAAPEFESHVIKIVLEQVAAVAGARAGDLTLDTNTVVDLGLDSLERLHIANSLEEIFGGRFPDEELQRIETCREVAEAVEKYIGAEPKNAPDLFTIGGEIKQDGGKREIPASHYEFSRMPEFIRFEQSRRELQDTGLQNPYFLSQDGVFGPAMTLNGKEIINFASHDYLGLAADSRLHECAKHAIDQYGTSVSASRLASGERPLYQDLEQALAETLDCEATAVFVSGYGANETTIGHLLGRGDLIVHDARTNRRLVKGAELSGARRLTFAHNQWEEINDLLRNERQNFRRVLIAVEGMCTVDGDFPDLPKLIELKHRYKTLLLVDQAHSLGTIGPCGRGLAEYYGVPAADVDVWTGSFSYALGSSGGYIAGSRKLVDYLKHTSPGFIFASGASPACVAAANAALQILKEEPEHIATLQANSQLFLQLAKQGNLDTGTSSETPIIPIIVGNSFDVLTVSERLIEQGFRAQTVVHPIVEESNARLCFFLTALHSDSQIRSAVAAVHEQLDALG